MKEKQQKEDVERLEEIALEMDAVAEQSFRIPHPTRQHKEADRLLLEAALLCGVPSRILRLYEAVEKRY